MKKYEYREPEFLVTQYKEQDVLTTSDIITPPWGGEIIDNPDFPPLSL